MRWWGIVTVLALLGAGAPVGTAGEPVLPLRVLYVGDAKSPRAGDFEQFLKGRFARAQAADRGRFDPAQAREADVVLLDWSQSETDVRQAASPFGPPEGWSKPTVLLGSAGLLLAGQWQIIGGAG
jgi:hypothetical protein